MAWIESHQELSDHPKTKRFKRALGLSQYEAIGALHMLWWWALEFAQEGDLTAYSDEDIADGIDWPGDAQELVTALHLSGFLDRERRLHDWHDYAGKLIARRRADAERKRGSAPNPPTVQPSSGGTPPDIHRNSDGEGPESGSNPYRTSTVTVTSTRSSEDKSPPEIVLLSSSGGAGGAAGAAVAACAPKTTAKVSLLPTLSAGAREVVDYYRETRGDRRPPKVNPTQARLLEEAVEDLGIDRLKNACEWAAKKDVSGLSAVMGAARTIRQNEESGGNPHAENRRHPGANGERARGAYARAGASSADEVDPFAQYVIRDDPTG